MYSALVGTIFLVVLIFLFFLPKLLVETVASTSIKGLLNPGDSFLASALQILQLYG